MADRFGGQYGHQNEKKIRFRTSSRVVYNNENKVEDLFNEAELRNNWDRQDISRDQENPRSKIDFQRRPSLFEFLRVELTRSYLLEHDEERYSARREKVYSFMKIPREVEKFMTYGFFQCADSFLFVYTFLPMRFIMAFLSLLTRPLSSCFGVSRQIRTRSILAPAEICDLLKACILISCSMLMFYIDTSMMYHLIKSQSVIKLYIFYNMLEVGDRLFSAFGQDTIDALFWTATEPRDRRREHLGVIPHLFFAVAYSTVLHSLLVLCQATTLNVAINSNNKALLTIMMSNNFVELKGSVFKKFDKNNLFQVSCSDVRERFHLFVLLFIVVLQTMREYSWKEERLWVLVPDCLMVLVAEVLVDWIKHAFITRFNELKVDVYRDYTISLAYDMAQTRQKHAFSDHSDLVARRMGFIPLPLGVVMVRVLAQALNIESAASISLFALGYFCVTSFRILISVVILGKACDLINQHRLDKAQRAGDMTPPWNRASSPTSHSHVANGGRDRPVVRQLVLTPGTPSQYIPSTPAPLSPDTYHSPMQTARIEKAVQEPVRKVSNVDTNATNLGPAAIFSNSAVDISNVCLNAELIDDRPALGMKPISETEALTRSEPNVNKEEENEDDSPLDNTLNDSLSRRAESEPSIPLAMEADEAPPSSVPTISGACQPDSSTC
ncbi:Protein TAPT1-like protein [Frankliniella fusca]|uniref:Protein TAPT1-like protein n=1 Tax=Frankliniella fusca TaxID=407009 RepID=A0AAE1HPD1_9NEOP|nr:Protein TAPT1-like protein [Frankliniella fusca]